MSKGKIQKKNRGMFSYLLHAVDKVFYQVYDGETLKHGNDDDKILEEEVLFCKNNVIVHHHSKDEEKDIAGYMNIKKVFRSDCEFSDLMLSWVPNTFLSNTSSDDNILLPPVPSEFINPTTAPIKCTALNRTAETYTECKQLTDLEVDYMDIPQYFENPMGNVFNVNIIDMKTVKFFYSLENDNNLDTGQFVIGSHNNEYKVFHFNNGGLKKLTMIFDQWNACSADDDLIPEEVGQKVYYINIKLNAQKSRDIPPEEGRYKALRSYNWMSFLNSLGQIEDSFSFRKHVFFGGLSHEVRPDAWKFLLYYYTMHSTRRERELMKDRKIKAYEFVHQKRLALVGEQYEAFWRKVQFTVEKDVVRTDRSHPYYAGQDNPNIQKMRNILLNYAVYNPSIGYTQGMSDLVAPLLATLHDEVDSFWCFVGLMEFSMFATTPTDHSMDKSLGFFRELLRLMAPDFYMHMLCNDEEMNMLFAHRWLVLCFKREFIFHEVLRIWEICWAKYHTEYFHIFICVAMVTLYGRVCVEKQMDAVEVLQYFSEMSMKFDGCEVLREARSLLHKLRKFHHLPCSLRGILSRNDIWDGGISPEIECVSNNKKCCMKENLNDEEAKKPPSKTLSNDVSQTIVSECPRQESKSDFTSYQTEKLSDSNVLLSTKSSEEEEEVHCGIIEDGIQNL